MHNETPLHKTARHNRLLDGMPCDDKQVIWLIVINIFIKIKYKQLKYHPILQNLTNFLKI